MEQRDRQRIDSWKKRMTSPSLCVLRMETDDECDPPIPLPQSITKMPGIGVEFPRRPEAGI